MKTSQQIMEEDGLFGLVQSLLDALSEVTLCPTCNGTKTFTPECDACLSGLDKCTCSTMEPETCPQCDGIGREFSGSKKAEEIMKTAEQIVKEARKLREEAFRALDAARQATLEGMLKRGEAWQCSCGQINGYHGAQCCKCGGRLYERRTTL